MGQFDLSQLKENKIAYLVIVVIVAILVIYAQKSKARETKGKGIPDRNGVDGNGTSYYYGRGSSDDSVSELLDRIDWSTYLEKRVTLWYRMLVPVLVAAILIAVLVMRKVPHPATLIILVILIFIPIYAIRQFDYVHGDVYNDYYIKRNVALLRAKLGLEKSKVKEPSSFVPKRTDVSSPL